MLKWAGLGALALILIAWVVSIPWSLWCRTAGNTSLVFGRGAICCLPCPPGYPSWKWNWSHDGWSRGWDNLRVLPYLYTGAPFIIFVPLWIPFALVLALTIHLWERDRPKPRGHCVHCGYNLTGNVSGVCPECGNAVEWV